MTSSLYGGLGNSTGNPSRSGATGISKPKAPSGYKTFENMTPEQMELMRQLMDQLGPDSYLSKLAGGDQEAFAELEAPALQQFSGLQGNIASRFSGMGQGGRRSSGFQNTMNQASSDFAQQLQSNRLNLRNQALQELMQYGNQLLTQNPYGLVEKQQKQSGWGGALGAAGGGALGFFASGGNPYLALQGANAGYQVGSKF